MLEIVLKLEDRYLSNLQPNLANARLAMLKKTPDKTYQKLEAEINELVYPAARGQKGDTTVWSATREMEVYKTALNEKDRGLWYQENQSRSIRGLPELTLSQAVDYLIKITAETNAFTSTAKGTDLDRDADSILRTKESKDTSQARKKEKRKNNLQKSCMRMKESKKNFSNCMKNREISSTERTKAGEDFRRHTTTTTRRANEQWNSYQTFISAMEVCNSTNGKCRSIQLPQVQFCRSSFSRDP